MGDHSKREAINILQEEVAALQAKPFASSVATAAEVNAVAGMPTTFSMTTVPATGSCAVQFVLKDADGVQLDHMVTGIGYIGTDAAGAASAAVSGSIAALTNGAVVDIVAKRIFHFITSATGLLGLTVTASAASYYVTLVLPNGKLLTSGPIVSN